MDWGGVFPGDVKHSVGYLKNTGTEPLALSMAFGEENITGLFTYIHPGWNVTTGQIIQPNQVVCADLTLTVYANATTLKGQNFSYNTTVTGSKS